MSATRRTLLASLAALPLAPVAALPASAAPDPIFALIERHRAAYVAFNAALSEDVDDAPVEDAAEHVAMVALTEQPPTTLAGLGAMAAYLDAHVTRTGDDQPAVWALETVAEACRLLIGGAA